MNAKPRVLVTSYYDRSATDPELERLQPMATVKRISVGRQLTDEELIAQLSGIQVTIISEQVFNQHVLSSASDLRMICADGVGVDNIDLNAATGSGVVVNNAPFVHDANGEFTIGLILAVMRRIVVTDRGVRADQWNDRSRYIGYDMNGRTLGLLGFGRAAQAVAKRARGFDVNVIAYSPHADANVARDLGVTVVGFDQLLQTSDILSIHVTLTDQTRGMIGRNEIQQMKTRSYLINTSRGAVIDEPALVEALSSGKLAGAGVDVFTQEPPAEDHPLFQMDNVVVTAHIASDSYTAFRAVFRGLVDDILLYINGERPTHIVNRDVLDHPHFRSMRPQ